MSENASTRRRISLDLKKMIIRDNDNGIRYNQIASKYKLPYGTVTKIIRTKDKILNCNKMPMNLTDSAKINKSIRLEMEKKLKLWCEKQSKEGPLNEDIVKLKAKQIFEKIKLESSHNGDSNLKFAPSRWWYNLFKKRCENLYFVNVSGAPSSFYEKLRVCIAEEGFCDQTVFNVCETDLYWKRFPDIKRVDDPDYKDTTSLILCGNAAGDFKSKPVVIYHKDSPKALKNKSKAGLPIIWKTNATSSMTASIFEDWFGHHFIPEVEKFCHSQNIPFKVLLLLKLGPHHPPTKLVDFDPRVRVIYLAHEVAQYQPMDQGIIMTFKAIYLKQLLEMMVQNGSDINTSWKALNILDAGKAISDSWSEVSKTTLNTAWRKLCSIFVQRLSSSTHEQMDEVVNDIVEQAKNVDLELSCEEIVQFLNGLDDDDESTDDTDDNASIKTMMQVDYSDEEIGNEMAVDKLAVGLEMIENGLRTFEEIDSNEDRVIAVRQRVQNAIAFYTNLFQKKSEEELYPVVELESEKPGPSSPH